MADLVVVDDDADVVDFLRSLLETHGHDVRVAHDGEAGLRLLRERIPDVLILDVQMPTLDGVAMMRRAAAEGLGTGHLVVILMSGRADLAALARQAGTPHILTKPCRIANVLAAVSRALATVPTP
jgi:CheY-like chemotaxis protein